MTLTEQQVSIILGTKDCADRTMNFFRDSVFYIKNLTQEQETLATKLIAAGEGAVFTGKKIFSKFFSEIFL